MALLLLCGETWCYVKECAIGDVTLKLADEPRVSAIRDGIGDSKETSNWPSAYVLLQWLHSKSCIEQELNW
jgi:hypothetical protein